MMHRAQRNFDFFSGQTSIFFRGHFDFFSDHGGGLVFKKIEVETSKLRFFFSKLRFFFINGLGLNVRKKKKKCKANKCSLCTISDNVLVRRVR